MRSLKQAALADDQGIALRAALGGATCLSARQRFILFLEALDGQRANAIFL